MANRLATRKFLSVVGLNEMVRRLLQWAPALALQHRAHTPRIPPSPPSDGNFPDFVETKTGRGFPTSRWHLSLAGLMDYCMPQSNEEHAGYSWVAPLMREAG